MAWAKGGIILLAASLRLARICNAACAPALKQCIATYDTTAPGRGPAVLCPTFGIFTQCFYTALPTCTAAEVSVYGATYGRMKANLLAEAPSCVISTTAQPVSARIEEVEESSSAGAKLKLWQWLLLGACLACCCIGVVACVCMNRRKNRGMHGGQRGMYDDNEAFEDYDEYDYSMRMDPAQRHQQMFQQGPPGMFPGAGGYPQQGAPMYANTGGYGHGYGGGHGGHGYDTATMPTTYDMRGGYE